MNPRSSGKNRGIFEYFSSFYFIWFNANSVTFIFIGTKTHNQRMPIFITFEAGSHKPIKTRFLWKLFLILMWYSSPLQRPRPHFLMMPSRAKIWKESSMKKGIAGAAKDVEETSKTLKWKWHIKVFKKIILCTKISEGRLEQQALLIQHRKFTLRRECQTTCQKSPDKVLMPLEGGNLLKWSDNLYL